MKAIILAAGKAKRMHSATPKPLQPILGKPLVKYVTDACVQAGVTDVTLVVNPDSGAAIRAALPGFHYVTQTEVKGTGHAVLAASPRIAPEDDVLILCGDMPLITADFIGALIDFYRHAEAEGVVTALHMPGESDFGRVFVSSKDMLARIVEHKDLTPNDPMTDLVNVSMYLFKGDALLYGLSRIDDKNIQREYYLTDMPGALRAANRPVKVFRAYEKDIFAGINNQLQLADATAIMRRRINARHMANGVRMTDPATVYIDDTVEIASGVVLYPGVILEGNCRIGKDAVVGPQTRLVNTSLGEGATAQYSVLTDAEVGGFTEIGPFAYLRPGAVIGEHCKIGDFVEVKNARVGDHSKASHLSYIGDADIGRRVNYSCGAITSNYDGTRKHRTVIEDDAFIGCNTNLVAPVTVGEGAYTAAGSTVTQDVPARALAIARERQVNKAGWKRK